jgi:Domain of unknown function (DUF4247)
MAAMSRNRLLLIAAGLAVAATALLIAGIVLSQRNIGSYIASHYHEYARDANGTRYACTGSPDDVADTLAEYLSPQAGASDDDVEYLRYANNVVIVGPHGGYPCSIRLEDLNAGYSHGAFVFLGPGFTPGSPAGGAGGRPGGPGGTK